ncbi:DUF2460 domain-containing protein [Acinetobacter sp. YH16049]|uniref:DUF2460 domain-containing protein n=1 Tax=Acinetobacter sp. YH16049 TaxID=2601188 RepID=UPI0015D3EFEA|nr:DUF2460 domain-containing protein [Acinetobacter sp. YH16049]
MSDVLFPELPGLEWDLSKKPIFNTKIMTSVNGRELRASYQAVPKYEISLSFAFLRENKGKNELQQLESFFIKRRGAFDSFLFKMPEDNEYSCSYSGDGSTTSFQLYKQMHTSVTPLAHTKAETVFEVDPTFWNEDDNQQFWSDNDDDLFWDDTTAQVAKSGIVTLSKPLKQGHKFEVKGTYYYRCRFADDEQQYTNFMSKLWKANKVDMIGSLGNKV